MRKHLWKGIATAAAFILLVAGASASAQMLGHEDEYIAVTVPFEFTVEDTQYAPGEFIVTEFSETAHNEMVIYPKEDRAKRQVFRVVKTADRSEADENELVFDVIDGDSHLAEVWVQNRAGYRLLSIEPTEREEKRVQTMMHKKNKEGEMSAEMDY